MARRGRLCLVSGRGPLCWTRLRYIILWLWRPLLVGVSWLGIRLIRLFVLGVRLWLPGVVSRELVRCVRGQPCARLPPPHRVLCGERLPQYARPRRHRRHLVGVFRLVVGPVVWPGRSRRARLVARVLCGERPPQYARLLRRRRRLGGRGLCGGQLPRYGPRLVSRPAAVAWAPAVVAQRVRLAVPDLQPRAGLKPPGVGLGFLDVLVPGRRRLVGVRGRRCAADRARRGGLVLRWLGVQASGVGLLRLGRPAARLSLVVVRLCRGALRLPRLVVRSRV